MQLVEFYGINTHFRIDGILQKESTVVFISKQLYGYMLHTVQCTLFELLQMHLHIRLDGSSAAQCPAFTFCRQIQIIDKIVAVVHQISIKSSRWNGLYILRHISQIYVQYIISPYLRSTVCYRLFFLYFFFGCLRCFGFLCRLKRNIIVIRLNDNTLLYQHRYLKTVFTFYQRNIFSLKSSYYSSSYFAKEADFISYFHIFFLFGLLRKSKDFTSE